MHLQPAATQQHPPIPEARGRGTHIGIAHVLGQPPRPASDTKFPPRKSRVFDRSPNLLTTANFAWCEHVTRRGGGTATVKPVHKDARIKRKSTVVVLLAPVGIACTHVFRLVRPFQVPRQNAELVVAPVVHSGLATGWGAVVHVTKKLMQVERLLIVCKSKPLHLEVAPAQARAVLRVPPMQLQIKFVLAVKPTLATAEANTASVKSSIPSCRRHAPACHQLPYAQAWLAVLQHRQHPLQNASPPVGALHSLVTHVEPGLLGHLRVSQHSPVWEHHACKGWKRDESVRVRSDACPFFLPVPPTWVTPR